MRYIKIYRKYILVDLYKYENKGAFYTEKEIDDYVELKLIKKLDDELFSILSVGEKIALEVLEKRNDGYNHLCDILIKAVCEKCGKEIIIYDSNIDGIKPLMNNEYPLDKFTLKK